MGSSRGAVSAAGCLEGGGGTNLPQPRTPTPHPLPATTHRADMVDLGRIPAFPIPEDSNPPAFLASKERSSGVGRVPGLAHQTPDPVAGPSRNLYKTQHPFGSLFPLL